MVEAAGIEPATESTGDRARVGLMRSKVGQDGSQVGQLEEVDACPMCKGRTGAGQNGSKAGRETSTTGAQRREGVGDLHDELAVVVEAWVRVPRVVRRAILGAVRAFEWTRERLDLN